MKNDSSRNETSMDAKDAYTSGNDGWVSGDSKTGAPGQAAAMRDSPSRSTNYASARKLENTNYRDGVKGSGKLSAPMPQKREGFATKVVAVNGGASSTGQIAGMGGDPCAYLGHFRNAETLKRGHNQGAPGGAIDSYAPRNAPGMTLESPGLATPPPTPTVMPTAPAAPVGRVAPEFNPITNPIAAARQAGRTRIAAARGAGGGLGAARAENRAAMRGARSERRARNVAGLRPADMAALRTERGGARAETRAAAAAPQRTAVGEAKETLRGAVGGVREARQALRSSIRGGETAGAGAAFGALQTARGERKAARKGVRTARRARS